jgi:hypothetical protein
MCTCASNVRIRVLRSLRVFHGSSGHRSPPVAHSIACRRAIATRAGARQVSHPVGRPARDKTPIHCCRVQRRDRLREKGLRQARPGTSSCPLVCERESGLASRWRRGRRRCFHVGSGPDRGWAPRVRSLIVSDADRSGESRRRS